MKNDISTLGTIFYEIEKHPCLKALLQLLPGWGVADELIEYRVNEIRKKRIYTFFEELKSEKTVLTDELMKNDEFIHAYLCTMKAVLNSRMKEKIQVYASLFKNEFYSGKKFDPDGYEELLSCLEIVSYKELIILRIMYQYELNQPKAKDENELQNALNYWENFKRQIDMNGLLSINEMNGFLARLERTGLYLRYTGSYVGYEGNIGRTTALYKKLKEKIDNETTI